MIKPFASLTHFVTSIPQEGIADPGKGLTALQTFTYFVATPVALFVVIGVLAWVGSRPKKAKSDVISQID